MEKIKTIGVIFILVGIVNLLLLITIPFLSDITVSTNLTLNATSNMSQYPGTSGFLLATPWILYFIPNVAGIIAIIIVLRRQSA